MLASDRFGNPDAAYSFDGVNDYIDVGLLSAITDSNEFSMSVWVRANIVKSQVILMLNPDAADNRLLAAVHYDHVGIPATFWDFGDISNNGRLTILNTTFSSYWEHYVFVTGSNGMYVYKDGVLQMTKNPFSLLNNRNRNLWIGGGVDVSNVPFYFSGEIDDLVLFERALTPNDVSQLFQIGQLPCSTLGVSEADEQIVTLSPNPAGSSVFLMFGNHSGAVTNIQVYNSFGQLVKSARLSTDELHSGELEIDVQDFQSGVYFVQLLSDNNKQVIRFVKTQN